MLPAIVLFAHGARDPAWALPLQDIASRLRAHAPGGEVRIAFLELLEPGLRFVLEELAALGIVEIHIAPVFWSQGGHVRGDLPALLSEFHAAHPGIRTRLLPVLSELPGMNEFVARALCLAARAPGHAG
jgi:sirohydrochlorin cobaltochelatase